MLFSFFLLSASLLTSQIPDTLKTTVVVADRGVVVSRTDTLIIDNSLSITEVLQQDPSLLVNDTGGEAGLKTVSLRGLGSAHTAIYVDGVRAWDVQNGQIDLGMLGMDNFSSAVVDYAQNSVSFNTERPKFQGDSRVAGKVNFTGGSFNTFLPSARLDFKITDRISLSANAAGVFSKGNYPYDEGKRRENNDISQIKAGLDLFGHSSASKWHVKAFWHSSDRGSAGSVDWPSEDRQKNSNAFLQGLYSRDISIYNLNLSAKVSYDDIYYTSSWGNSRYGQTELQLNSSHKFRIRNWWNCSLAADIQWDKLGSTNYDNSRLSGVVSLATAFSFRRFKANAALEYDGAGDASGKSWSCLSPSVDLRLTVFKNFDIIAFARRAYRIPSFNELYYVGYGNPELKPEDATLLDLGMEWKARLSGEWTLKAKVDGFYNYLKDKIISSPSPEDPNIWRPFNIGVVRSVGADSSVGLDFESGEWKASFGACYTFQSATDRTPDSTNLGEQIPYVAKHTLVLTGKADFHGWGINAIWNLRSDRRDSYGEMPDWNTLDVILRKILTFRKTGPLTLKLTGRNLTDSRYDLSSGYPMPGISVLGGIEFKF